MAFCNASISWSILSLAPLLPVVTATSSTFVNWCTRYRPRLSSPRAPASARYALAAATWRIGVSGAFGKEAFGRLELCRDAIIGISAVAARHHGGAAPPCSDVET